MRIALVGIVSLVLFVACGYTARFSACEVVCTPQSGCPPGLACSFTSSTTEGLCGTTASESCAATLGISFLPAVDFPTEMDPTTAALADLDGDGKLDIAVVNYVSGTVSVLLNTTAPGSMAPSFIAAGDAPTGSGPLFIATGDINSDGNLHRSPSRVWPLAVLNGREPVVLGTAVSRHRDDHEGVELAYPRVDETDAVKTCPIDSPNGTANYIMPAFTPALAVDDGSIIWAGTLGHGYSVTIYHGGGWASHYANLQALCVIRTDLYRPREQHVRAGDSIGIVGGPKLDQFRRLYFEWWHNMSPTDPRPYLAGWPKVEHFDHFTSAPPTSKGGV